jgi:Tfp pilus assembly protein PilF
VWSFDFLKWDDQLYVTANPHVVGGLTWSNVVWALTSTSLPYWHPLTRLSHLLDVQLFGMTAASPHVVNVVIHLVNTLLVWALFATMTRARWASFVVAAVFAVHPLHVESVAWIAERKDVLSTFFALCALLAYVAYVRTPSWARYATVAALVALALMTKPMVVTLPFAILLLDVWPLGRTSVTGADGAVAWSALVREKAPLIAMSVLVAAVTVAIEHGTIAMQHTATLPLTSRIGDAIQAYVSYLGHAVWPSHLSAFYPRDWTRSPALVGVDLVILVVLTVAVTARRTQQPYLFVGWLWFLLGLAPVVGFLQSGEQATADRFMYVPLIGLTAMAVWGLADATRTLSARGPLLASAAAAVVITCAVVAREQVSSWQTDVTLWAHAVAVTDENYLAENLLGLALQERGDNANALGWYRAALRDVPPGEPDLMALVHTNIGDALARTDQPRDAIAEYEAALTLDPQLPQAESDLGSTLVTVGRPAEAIGHYQAALALQPGFAAAENGYGAALTLLGRTAEAEEHYRAAVADDPTLAMAHTNLAMALASSGQTRNAVSELLVALKLEPNHAAWEFNVGALLMKQGLTEEATPHFTSALAIDPTFERAQKALETISASAR